MQFTAVGGTPTGKQRLIAAARNPKESRVTRERAFTTPKRDALQQRRHVDVMALLIFPGKTESGGLTSNIY